MTNKTPPPTDHLQAIHALCDDMVGRMVGYRTTEATVPELEQIKQHAEAMKQEIVRLTADVGYWKHAAEDPGWYWSDEHDADRRPFDED